MATQNRKFHAHERPNFLESRHGNMIKDMNYSLTLFVPKKNSMIFATTSAKAT